MRRIILLALLSLSLTAHGQVDNIGSGRCLSFDGLDDYVDLGNIYDDIELPVTISAWVYIEPTSQIVTFPIFDSQDNSSIYNGFTMTVSTIPHVGITYGDGVGGNNPAFRRAKAGFFNSVEGQWMYITGIMRGARDMDIYINGINIDGTYEGSSSLPMNSDSPTEIAKIGYWLSNGILYRFKGLMDELRIWNRSLNEFEIRQSMCKKLTGNEPDLIGYWDFNETSGLTLFDKSPNQFHGELKGNPKRVFSGAPIGDESVFQYASTWDAFQMEDLTVRNIQGGPAGIHIYKINSVPSQTSGLNANNSNSDYYGVFTVNDGEYSTFDIDMVCQPYLRTDNSVAVWEAKNSININDRTEIIFGLHHRPSSFDLGSDLEFCDRDSYTLNLNIDMAGKSILWNTGETASELTVNASGEYKVIVTEGCDIEMDSITVTFLPSPTIDLELGEDIIVCNTDSYQLKTKLSSAGKSFLWSTGETTPEITITNSGEYQVEVSEGCTNVQDKVFVTILPKKEKMIPNIITPNNDQLNQYFIVEKRIDSPVRLEVFNRWGRVVYRSYNYNSDWDGDDLSAGVYFYSVKDECDEIYKGILTICR